MILFITMIVMAMTLQEFLMWEKVYAQTSLPKPPIDSSEINIEELQQIQQELNNQQKNEECKQNILWSTRDTVVWSCTCEKGMVPDKLECRKTCPDWYTEINWVKQNECLINTAWDLWIDCAPEKLINGTCSRNINKTLGVRQSDTTPNPTVLLQDIVLAATSFVGTMIMIALVVMGIKYVKWWYDESSTGDLKGNIRKLLIWLFLVIGSYTIIRLVQYVARGY